MSVVIVNVNARAPGDDLRPGFLMLAQIGVAMDVIGNIAAGRGVSEIGHLQVS